MDLEYTKKILYKVAIIVLLVGALNWLVIGVIGINPVEKVLGYRSPWAKGVYILVGLCALGVMFNRDTYLPFLGETVMPCSALAEQIPENADTEVQVEAPVGSKVLYWAAENETEGLKKLNDWRGAYMKFLNVGVVKANGDGIATLYVRKPQPYTVPWKGKLEPHVHFRICGDNGMMGRIKTVYLSDGRVEGFTNM